MNWKIGVVLLMIFQCEVSWGDGSTVSYYGVGPTPPPTENVDTGTATLSVSASSTGQSNPTGTLLSAPDGAQKSKSEAAKVALTAVANILNAEAAKNPKVKTAQGQIANCQSGIDYADICIAGTNPGLLTAAGAIGLLLEGAAQLKMSDACSKMNKALELGKSAMTVYNTTCSAAHMYCSSSCKALLESVQKAGSAAVAHVQETVTLCDSYVLNQAAAAAGILQMVTKSRNMDQCKSATTIANCALDPSNPQCPKPLDCTKPANAQNATCICLASPNSPGCPGAIVSNTGTPKYGVDGKGNGLASTKENSEPTSNILGADDPGFVSPTGGSGSAGKSAGFGAGSGGGGAGGQGGGSGATKEAKNDQRKGLNANILGGFDGGGGSGGSGGTRSSSGLPSSGLRAYMPGGAKDPSRNLASQTFGNGEVTAAGAKSNWEKVRDRYVENKPSLIGP